MLKRAPIGKIFTSVASLAIMSAIGVTAVATPLAKANAASVIAPAKCEKDLTFGQWVDDFKHEARASGISARTIEAVSPFLVYDQNTIRRDRAQGVFLQTFLQFSERMATAQRAKKGNKLIVANQSLFSQIESQYGVPASVIVAFWALESDFGVNTGKFQILSALTTLSFDCRRPDFFRPQLLDALRIVDRGDLAATEMIGNWAGELGATQFAPTGYYKFGVDFDHDGRVDLLHSVPDTLATTANFLSNLGWQRGQPWLQEVHVPDNLPWQEADIAIQHPLSQWRAWGVTGVNQFPQADLDASLLLPMGRFGPAFLAYPNFRVFIGWNSALIYSTTAALLANKIDGAPPIGKGKRPITPLTLAEMTELQTILAQMDYEVGAADGKLGAGTRQAVKKAQLKLGLPADSYPDQDLLSALRGMQATP